MSGRLALVLWLWLVTARLAAQSDDELLRAKASFKAGAAAYGAGDYTAAIEALGLAYELTPLPAIAFSLAQAERRQYFVSHARLHLDHAVALFRRYIEQVPSAGRRSDALEALSQLEPLLLQPSVPEATTAQKEERRTRIMISTLPEGASVSLDGGEPAPAPLIREVEPGKHRVRVAASGYVTSERDTTAVAGELILSEVELRELPSRVLLSTASGAEIYVDGRFARRGGAHVELPLSSGAHELRVVRAGRRPFAQTVRLEPGQQLSVDGSLALSGQRKAARGLFVVSAALLVTSGALVGVAWARERRAQDFLDRRERMNVSSAALARYRDDLQVRDRLRVPAILTGTLAMGSMLAALLLHLLDDADAYEREPQASSESRSKTSAVNAVRRVSPLWLAHGAGLRIAL